MNQNPILQIKYPDAKSENFTIEKDIVKIGRAPDNNIVLNFPNVSRYHAEIFKQENKYTIKNVSGQNILKLNGTEIKEANLYDNGVIQIGSAQIIFNYNPLRITQSSSDDETILGTTVDKNVSAKINSMQTVLASSSDPSKAGETFVLSKDNKFDEILISNLKIKLPNKPERDFLLTKSIITIGRDGTNELILDDPYIARKQAEIVFEKNNYVLEDFGGKNPVRVNGKPCKGKIVLKNGHKLYMGRTTLIYQALNQDDARSGKITAIPYVNPVRKIKQFIGIAAAVIVLIFIIGIITNNPLLSPVTKMFHPDEAKIEAAEKLVSGGEISQAAGAYQKILTDFPNTKNKDKINKSLAICYYTLGQSYIDKRDFENARKQFAQAQSAVNNEEDAIYKKSAAAIAASFFKEAGEALKSGSKGNYISLLKKIIDEYPESAEAKKAKEIIDKEAAGNEIESRKKMLLGRMEVCLKNKFYVSPPENNLAEVYKEFIKTYPDDKSFDEYRIKAIKDIENDINSLLAKKKFKDAEDKYNILWQFKSNFEPVENDEKGEGYKSLALESEKDKSFNTALKYIKKSLEFKGGKDDETEKIKKRIEDKIPPVWGN